MESYLDFPIKNDILKILTSNAKDYALLHGISMHAKDLSSDAVVPLPFTLFPSSFSSTWFQYAKSVQTDINAVIHNVAHDDTFLSECLKSTIEVDEFTSKLFGIYNAIRKEGLLTRLSLGLFRSDYMLNTNNEGKNLGLKQVEVNAIASSFGGLCPQLRELHQYILSQLNILVKEESLPLNPATDQLTNGLYSAWKAYGNPKAIILFVVEEITMNISDQRILEFHISRKYSNEVKVIRARFSEMRKTIMIIDQRLFINDKEIAVVYYRTGYDPAQYQTEDWDIRLMIERSEAIKCPSVCYQLAGTKKVQQELCLPGVLERFLLNKCNAMKIRELFAKQYALDMGEEGDKAVKMGLENPEKFVMKPQREGGGNNVYGNKIRNMLAEIGTSKQREAYILMERIQPPSTENYIIRRDENALNCHLISELGIFGVILGSKNNIVQNYEAGHLLRSKQQDSDEGGIAAGFGALDTPFLI